MSLPPNYFYHKGHLNLLTCGAELTMLFLDSAQPMMKKLLKKSHSNKINFSIFTSVSCVVYCNFESLNFDQYREDK